MSLSVNAILANNANLVRSATLSASIQRASTDLRQVSRASSGGGALALGGTYTGATDSLVEAEILSGAGADLVASRPVVRGIGSGILTPGAIAVDAVPETITFALLAAGDPDTYAQLPFFGVVLQAMVAGEDGNDLSITVERNLVEEETDYATLSSIAAGATALEGPQWDFGAVAATGTSIPITAPRLTFVGHPEVYRHWKTWTDGRWVYHLDPSPLAEIAADTRVLSVTGDYTLTLTNGTDEEEYTVTTVYELLAAVRGRSALIEVVGTVADDRAPGGQGITDIPLRTDAYAMAIVAELSSPHAVRRLDDVTVAEDAPTENIIVLCQGGNTWSVAGAVSGALGTAMTGTHFASGPIGFKIIPVTLPVEDQGGIRSRVELVAREEGEVPATICVNPLLLGARAMPGTWRFVYTLRPSPECQCADITPPRIDLRCLGLDAGDFSMALDPEYQSRLDALYRWRAEIVAADVELGPPSKWRTQDMDFFDAVVRTFADCLAQIFESADALDEWDDFWTAAETEIAALSGMSVYDYRLGPGLQQYLIYFLGQKLYNAANGHLYTVIAGDHLGSSTLLPEPGDPVWEVLGGESVLDGVLTNLDPTTVTVEDEGEFTLTDLAQFSPELIRPYQAEMDLCLAVAGIVPKSDASTGSGVPCWRDDPNASAWWVESEDRYFPAFTGQPYVSVSGSLNRMDEATATHEFGFAISVACGTLKVGDAVTIIIEGTPQGVYADGDRYTIPVIGPAAAPFVGGSEGDPTQTWTVRGDVSGVHPDWELDPETPVAYSAGPLDATLTQGGIPWAVGDAISVSLEGGQVRWRRDAGAWETESLYGGPIDLADGLTLTATPGVAPSFVAGDSWSWSALASHGPDRLRQPRAGQAWSWDDADAVLELDLGSVQPIGAILLALHSLPTGASIVIGGGVLAATDWSIEPAWSAGPILAMIDPQVNARYLSLTLADCGTGAGIGWLLAGVPWTPTTGVSAMTHVRQYGLSRGGGLNPSAVYRGRGTGGRWSWDLNSGAALLPADMSGLLALLDHVAEQGLEWVCLVPDVRAPSTAALAQIDADEVSFTDHLGYQLDGQALTSVDLPFRAVLL